VTSILTPALIFFETYSRLLGPTTEMMEKLHPKDPEASKVAYGAALRAKVLDCLRGLLPAGTLTNMGVYGNGRFFETLMHKLHTHNLAELQEIGKSASTELSKVIPSFVRRSDPSHRHHKGFADFYESMGSELKLLSEQNSQFPEEKRKAGVRLISFDQDAPSESRRCFTLRAFPPRP